MAIAKTPPPAPTTPAETTFSGIADAGAGLNRLLIAAITLPLTTANAFGTVFTRLITSVTAALDGAASPQGTNEIVKATTDVITATTGLYVTLLKAAIGGLDAAAKAINTAVAEATSTPRK